MPTLNVVKKLHKLILADHKLKLYEIAEDLKISEGSVFTISHEHLSMRKLRLLTVDQKQRKGILCKYVTMDETWIHHFTPESNRQSAEWTAAGESQSKRPKTQTLASKVLASIFWDAQGILLRKEPPLIANII